VLRAYVVWGVLSGMPSRLQGDGYDLVGDDYVLGRQDVKLEQIGAYTVSHPE
jgi:hypothetical protein